MQMTKSMSDLDNPHALNLRLKDLCSYINPLDNINAHLQIVIGKEDIGNGYNRVYEPYHTTWRCV